MNIITTELPIGKFSVYLSSRKVVHILDLRRIEYGLSVNTIVFRSLLKTKERTFNGWTSTTIIHPEIFSSITDPECLIYLDSYKIFDINTGEVLDG